MNLDGELALKMGVYRSSGISDVYIGVIQRIEAGKIAERARQIIGKELDIVKRIDSGDASFGMTTYRQEFEKRAEFVQRFEFNCLQLRDFKAKYNL